MILGGTFDDTLLGGFRSDRQDLECDAVAVRSSATVEDMEDASFAGQYESTLNVNGEKQLLQAIRECWASVWSAHALDYRHQRAVDHRAVRMALVIQQMVSADTIGVCSLLTRWNDATTGC